MVARSEDRPRTTVGRQTHTERRIDELARTVGRGAPALRDSSGNVLEMNPNAPYPLLGPQGTDAAVAFTPDGTIKITSADTTEDRDMTVRLIHASDSVGTSGNLIAQGDVNVVGTVIGSWVHSTGNINADVSIGAGLNIIAGGNVSGASANFGPLTSGQTQTGNLVCGQVNTSGDIFAPGRNISTDPAGIMHSALYVGGTFQGHGVFDSTTTISDAQLKTDFSEVDDADVDALLVAPVQRWRWRADITEDDREHVGPVAQDMPEIAAVETDDGRLGIDQTTYSGLLLALCQRQQRQIDELTARLEALE